MIGVKKIAHASYETPDLDQQVEYYTDILGLIADRQGQGRGLSRHHRRSSFGGAAQGRASAQCVRLGFQLGPDDDLDAFEKQTAAHGIKTRAQEGSRADHRRHGHLRGSQGHRHGGVQAPRAAAPDVSDQGHRAAQARPRRLPSSPTSSGSPTSIATCSASGCPTGWATSSRSCAAGPTITPST